MYIHLTDKIKIKSPLDNADIFSYEGAINNIDFLQQKKNYNKIQDILAEYDMQLSYIWFAEFNRNVNFVNCSTYHFVAKTDNNRIFWRKYEGKSKGSGQNYLYIDGKQFKLTHILKMSKEDRDSLFISLP